MISSHKRLLLSGCRHNVGNGGTDLIRIVCADGHTHVNVLILVSMMPWLKEVLLEQQLYSCSSRDGATNTCQSNILIVPSLSLSDLNTFMYFLLSDNLFDSRRFYDHASIENAARNVTNCLCVPTLEVQPEIRTNCLEEVSDDILFEENYATVYVHTDAAFSTNLSDVDIHHISDKTITDSFSNQEGRLVCLVCYKIFPPDFDISLFKDHFAAHPSTSRKRVHLPGEQVVLVESSMNTTKADVVASESPVSKSHTCSTCQKRFKKLTLLNQHQFRMHGMAPALSQLSCSKCDFKSCNLSGLKAHLRGHDTKDSFNCQDCGRKFGEARCLQSHLKSGSCKLENRRCKICSKVFTDPTRLRIHALTHTGEKPWSCKICEKSFNQHRSLKEHQLIHSERPHGCTMCDKRFVQKNHLKYHMTACHGGGSNPVSAKHVCKICSRSYAFPFQLRKHESQHVNKLIRHFKATETQKSEKKQDQV